MDRIEKILVAAVIAFSLGVLIVSSQMQAHFNDYKSEQEKKYDLVCLERDSLNELAEQYKKQYEASLKEISVLKERLAVKTAPDEEIGWDFDYVVRVVGAEARGEPWEGKLAVCQCIQETAERTGKTPYEVVQKGYASPVGYDVMDGMEDVNEACLLVFLNGYKPFTEPIQYFYSTENGFYSKWHESQVFCYEIGTHRYFKEVEQ